MMFLRSAFVLLLVFTVSLCESDDTTTSELLASNTTVAPVTTTTAPPPTTTVQPTPTHAPTPAPVDKSEWVVTGVNQTVCILAKMNITVKVPYIRTDNNQTVVKQFDLNPYNTNSTGNCTFNNSSQTLTVMGENITATFVFGENSTTKNYNLRTVNFTVAVNNFTFPNSSFKENLTLVHASPEFTTPTKMSYTCSNPDPFLLNSTQPTNTSVVTLILSNVHIEAFGAKKDRSFSEALDCNTFETPDIVPIAVGCALAALVIVVLISYLVGRRRSQARGYLSM